jgi:hypothetical protein
MSELQQPETGSPKGFYVFLGTMGLTFLVIVGYMVSMYLS